MPSAIAVDLEVEFNLVWLPLEELWLLSCIAARTKVFFGAEFASAVPGNEEIGGFRTIGAWTTVKVSLVVVVLGFS